MPGGYPFARRLREIVHSGRVKNANKKVVRASQAKLPSSKKMGRRRQQHAKITAGKVHTAISKLRLRSGRLRREED